MQFAQLADSVDISASSLAIDLKPFVGTWLNSNHNTSGINSLDITQAAGTLTIQCNAAGTGQNIEWQAVNASVFSNSPTTTNATGFTCEIEFGFKSVRLLGMLMKGLLVLAQIHSFHDDSGRVDYFAREYYSQKAT